MHGVRDMWQIHQSDFSSLILCGTVGLDELNDSVVEEPAGWMRCASSGH